MVGGGFKRAEGYQSPVPLDLMKLSLFLYSGALPCQLLV